MCNPPRIYHSLPEYTQLPFQQLYATLSESTPPSHNIPPFLTTIIFCEPSRVYPSLPEYNPLFNNSNIMRPSQNLPLPPRIYPLLNNAIRRPRNLPLLPEYTPLFNNYMRPSQNLPLPPWIYPLFHNYVQCNPPRIYPEFFSSRSEW